MDRSANGCAKLGWCVHDNVRLTVKSLIKATLFNNYDPGCCFLNRGRKLFYLTGVAFFGLGLVQV